jgi:putative sterol carrier protein
MAEKLTSVQEIFEKMPATFLPDKAGDAKAVTQYIVSGDGGGNWHVVVADGKCTVEQGEHASADVTITMTDKNFIDFMNGDLNPTAAMMTRKLVVKGNMALAMKMDKWFAEEW